MTVLALVLVITGAIIHAIWNLLVKRSAGGWLFVWAYSATSSVFYFPLALWAVLTAKAVWSLTTLGFVLASGVLHIGYSLLLQTGYRRGGLSVVYPVARGVGPALSVVGAIAFLGEKLTLPTAAGAAFVVSGVMIIGLARPQNSSDPVWPGIRWGAAIGLFIAGYTLNDGAAVRLFAVSPIIIDYFGNFVRVALLAPMALRNRAGLREEFAKSRNQILLVGALIPIPYILALYAMKLAPISVIAPARELSMLAGVFLAWRFLNEGDMVRRLIGALLIAAGVATLSFG